MIDLTTDRLKLRQWSASDFEAFAHFFADAANAHYVGGQKSREEAWRLMATYIGHYQLNGFSYMAIEDKSAQKLVGCVGLWNSEPWPELELGYWLLPAMQGKGYAFEAARKVKNYAFEVLKQPTLVSYIDPANTPSQKLATRLGGVYEKDIQLLDLGLHQVYRYSPNK
ncbi:MAG TPA: N-acetyltransferase [Microscillaceae bacterium]|nr:N-acetyltransferase [Microscillaceae bacterium]